MAAQVAQIIDLKAYRQSRLPSQQVPAAIPMVYVAIWTYVPVMLVPSYS